MVLDLKDKINFFKILNFSFKLMVIISLSFFLAAAVNSYIFYKFFNLNENVKIVHTKVQKLAKSYNNVDYLFKTPVVQKVINKPSTSINSSEKEVVVQPSNINIKLIGTIITKKEKAAFIKSNGQLKFVKINDKVGNLKVKDIKNYSIVLTDGVHQYEISLMFKEGSSNIKKTKRVAKTEYKPPTYQSEQDTYRISKREVEKETADLGKILRYVRIIPVVKNGETKGYKLAYVSPRSILYKYGLRSGDFIVSVNGMPVKTAEEAFRLYNILRNEKTITLVVERKGQQKTITYEIQ
jgi:general secretion pathway protein C